MPWRSSVHSRREAKTGRRPDRRKVAQRGVHTHGRRLDEAHLPGPSRAVSAVDQTENQGTSVGIVTLITPITLELQRRMAIEILTGPSYSEGSAIGACLSFPFRLRAANRP